MSKTALVRYLVPLTKEVDIFDCLDGQVVTQLKAGQEVGILERQAPGYDIQYANGKTGWIHEKDLDLINQLVDRFLEKKQPAVLLPYAAKSKLKAELKRFNRPELIKKQLSSADELQILLDDAHGMLQGDPESLERFEVALSLFIERSNPPQHPESFSLESIASGLPFEEPEPFPGLPDLGGQSCLVNLDALELLGQAVLHYAYLHSSSKMEHVNDILWAAYWVIGERMKDVNRLEILHHTLEQALDHDPIARTRLEVLFNPPMSPQTGVQNAEPISLPFHDFPEDWVPGRFPGDRLELFFPCRAEQAGATWRATQCCGQTYTIEEITSEGCFENDVMIRGRNFGSDRSWHLGDLQSTVTFSGPRGTRIEATEYRGWSDTLVKVGLPAGAIAGPVEMSILCTHRVAGEHITDRRCGIQTRYPAHRRDDPISRRDASFFTPRTAAVESVQLLVDGNRVREAEACKAVQISIVAINTERVTVTDERGATVPLVSEERAADGRFSVSAVVVSHHDETYTIQASSSCGDSAPQTVEVRRYFMIHTSRERISEFAAATRAIPLAISVSCDPALLDPSQVDEDQISLQWWLEGSIRGVSFPERILHIPRGDTVVRTTVLVDPGACGRGRIRLRDLRDTRDAVGVITEYDVLHRRGQVDIEIVAGHVDSVFSGTFVALVDDTHPEELRGEFSMGLRFASDRSTVSITSLDLQRQHVRFGYCDREITINLAGSEIGTWQPTTGALNIPAQLSINIRRYGPDCSWFDDTSPMDIVFTTAGTPVESDGSAVLVGTGRFTGGWIAGSRSSAPPDRTSRDWTITLTGLLDPPAPRACGG